jgi:cell division transport system permease protein
MAKRSRLRPARFDELGLKRALSDRLLPMLVASMTFLAALTLAGVAAASGLALHWRDGAASVVTVQVPQPKAASGGGSRAERVVSLLRGTPGIGRVSQLSDDELAELLQPWLGNTAEMVSLPLPAVIEVRLASGEAELPRDLEQRLAAAAPGTFVEGHGVWLKRLSLLARSLQACASAALLVVAGVSAAVVAVATRAGLSARRDAIEIVHGLGATDGYIAAQFANRATVLAVSGAAMGDVCALPVLLGLATLAAPFTGAPSIDGVNGIVTVLPASLWIALPLLPAVSAAIGWTTAQVTVRRWLRRLP